MKRSTDGNTVDTSSDIPIEVLRHEGMEQLSHEREIERKDNDGLATDDKLTSTESSSHKKAGVSSNRPVRANFKTLLDFGKSKRTSRLLMQIWKSDYTIIAYVLTAITFFLMKRMNYPPMGVLFFLLAMAVVDAILSIFVTRLSVHQHKHDVYSPEDFARDWLRYRILLSMTKAALLFVVGTSCGTAAAVGCYVMWFFTSTQRLRYLILRWSMEDHFPELERWSIFVILREAGIKPKLGNYNIAAILGVALGFTIALVF
jgi:Na+/melibiose symporter-like transporter